MSFKGKIQELASSVATQAANSAASVYVSSSQSTTGGTGSGTVISVNGLTAKVQMADGSVVETTLASQRYLGNNSQVYVADGNLAF